MSSTNVAAVRHFPLVAKAVAVLLLLFFVGGFVASALELHFGQLLDDLLRWGGHGAGGHGGRAYELMIESIYIVWALFLWRAANDPAKNSLFMDFTVLANAAHFGTMAVMSLVFPGEHAHLYGDVLGGFVLLAIFAVTWASARPTYRTLGAGQGVAETQG